mmetsp:Transcript_64883/g.154946  ORF Transcript_64883/g.154946 Transcript_64883/m.154946 type:complete len:537 (-) Transcript_64883:158-1768(-)|eukprot:CAMPEP_0178414108 /NCGR_PEP_ID=MMETSP0689_2-20121128/22867_1 /TAXON_ID=160604 /ORGANISM="Amphidinium massartii, Strain CS-259" /LENGTH=536 /DNA_ID=CAMNT_0020035389 /DNA_START=1 /DNA_END=1611 /DNA_ORIENTATION=-
MAAISDWLKSAFRKSEYRVLSWGFYGGGSTTGLYKLKLGETVSTMPTIGFNVETIPVKGANMTMWDLGGRDRIRPLWRHYFANTQALIFYVDSTVREEEHFEFMRDELDRFLREDELRGVPVLIFANKQDLPRAMTVEEVTEVLRLADLRDRPWYVQATCATSGDGLPEGMEWLMKTLRKKDGQVSDGALQAGKAWLSSLFSEGAKQVETNTAMEEASSRSQGSAPAAGKASHLPKSASAIRQEVVLAGVLQDDRADNDEEFWTKFNNSSLDPWDHVTLLRLMWLLLTLHGRRTGKDRIFEGLQRLHRGEPFPRTIAYFWMHMVHYAIVATVNPTGDFKGFLAMNPQLCDAHLTHKYYSEETLLNSPEARTEVVLPDKQSLPSVLAPSVATPGAAPTGVAETAKPKMDDDELLDRLQDRTLPSWGHEVRLHAIWALLLRHGRRQGGTTKVLQALQDFEGDGYHLTESYFWVQLVTMKMAEAPGVAGLEAFLARASCQPLLRSDFILDFYSESVLSDGKGEFRIPDKKQMPNTLRSG